MVAHENIVWNNKGERAPSSYSYEPIVYMGTTHEASWRQHHRWRWLRGHFPIPAGCRNRDLCPPELGFSMAAELACVSGKIVGYSSVFRSRVNL